MPHLYFISLFFLTMDHFFSPQTYVVSVSYYDKFKTPTFFFMGYYVALRATAQKAGLGSPRGARGPCPWSCTPKPSKDEEISKSL